MNDRIRGFHRVVFIIALILHALTAWFSTGYHSEDEHHQVIGFAETWSGELPPGEQAWEYQARIRASALPWIAVGVFKAAHVGGIDDPFTKALLLRMLTTALALIAVRGFVRAMLDQLSADLWKPFVVLSYFLWFLPFLHVRFSSETWSGLFLLMGLTAALKNDRDRWWAVRTGALLATAVWIRPPVAVIVTSFFLWVLLVRKDTRQELFRFVGAAAVVLLLSVVMDSSFYGTWTISPWRYAHIGVIGDPEHVFDALPWYYYVPWVVKYAIPPIGLCLLLALLLLLWKRPTQPLVWCVLPFLLIHSILPHKEIRFLYPLADLMPILMIAGYQEARPVLTGTVNGRPLIRLCVGLFAVVNTLGLAVASTSPAGNGRVDLAPVVRDRPMSEPIRIAYLTDPKFAWRVCFPHFYRARGTSDTIIATGMTVDAIPADLLIARATDVRTLNDRCGQCMKKIVSAEPEWTTPLLRLYSWGDRPEPWMLYAAEPSK